MRVALLSGSAPSGDAIGQQVANKAAFFLDRGAEVRVFVQDDRGLHPVLRPLTSVQPTGRLDRSAWRYVLSCDLVVVEFSQHDRLIEEVPRLVGRKPRIIIDYHGITPPEAWGTACNERLREGERWRHLVWAADAVLVHSHFSHEELATATGFPPARTFRVGYPVSPVVGSRDAAEAFRGRLGLADAALVLFVGRLAANKRVPLLVEALARLRDRRPNVHLVVIGDDTDVYQAEAERCRSRAEGCGVAERLHILGKVDEAVLAAAYAAADVLVLPSRHEGFGLPVVEAMAAGVPVIAARAGALPETVASAGLTFEPEDAADLARQLGRVLDGRGGTGGQPSRRRLAVVSFRYGTDFVGGAETSLRLIAGALHAAGHVVEVFSTCTRAEFGWTNQLPAGTESIEGIPVHRFPVDPHDRRQHDDAVQRILASGGYVPPLVEQAYLRHSIHSTSLLEALGRRLAEFDALIAGPYLFGLTADVAATFPDKTLLLPCFHDEACARLRVWREIYGAVGGILYHTAEEQALAERVLGLNHPGATEIGTLVNAIPGDPERGRSLVGGEERYVVYCGRYTAPKNVPLLIEYLERYERLHPGRFRFVWMGQGDWAIPRRSSWLDLGFVDERRKRDVLAGADALVQLSRQESLSLAALEAWSQGTPVIAHA
ncbi:MAG: glycosyltransferase family 4 protein, partial [Gemmataceae bacterium]|nr:glycosyltransferase family 4 protein [Gemmataceae bacterium]